MTQVEVSGSVPRLPRREIAKFVASVLGTLRRAKVLAFEVSEVSIAFVDDAAMTHLNQRYRRKRKTTDVLTFPADESYAEPSSSGRPLGDIVISIDQARRQAAEEKHSLATEVRYLILHGLLHSLGYDHDTDGGEMNALEVKVRGKVGLE
ncbi:MAG: rRNA maturation RNase YbeY [Thermoanaerobaculia bacterium]